MLRLQHRSYRTERSYVSWIRRFLAFIGDVPKSQIDQGHLKRYLTHLAADRRVASATQQQAFNALLYLYRLVLDVSVDGLRETIRSRRSGRLPVVLTPREVQSVLDGLSGQYLLMAELIYGAGLRLGCEISVSSRYC
ncbi:MAG: phage integrase N-terminal SAM-like domain-containing protein [Spirochaetaceae bacterium]|nr:phage integrase N-terminal SAM-like domain-containing protein [Spirochaetaceae bacterium]